uniref:Secretogranin-2 n=1 Tax=Neogobius melanostomus TaxID=47308 RepID=A0A8C6S5A7_9GOBI
MKSKSAMPRPSPPCASTLLLLLPVLLSGITAASLRDHRLRGADSNVPSEDMLKALEYIQSLRQSANRRSSDFERSTLALEDQQSDEPRSERQEDRSEELLQAVLSTLQQTEKAGDQGGEPAKEQALPPPRQKLPSMFEDDRGGERSDDLDRGDTLKRTNENVEEKYTPQTLATLQSVFDELGRMTSFNSKRENGEEEDEDLLNARDLAYDEGDWGQGEAEDEERNEVERALDYLDANEQENDESFASKRSDDEDDGETANLADFYLLKVLEQTEEEEQKKRALEDEEERMERAAEFRNNIDPKLIYRLLQISQKYQIPPEVLIDMLRSGERLKVAPVYAKKTYKRPPFFSGRRLPVRQKTPDEMRTARILKILGLSGDENSAQSPLRKQYKNIYSRPAPWRQESPVARQQQQTFPAKLKDDYDDTENQLATFLAARMLSKYPTYKSKTSQKREDDREEEEEAGSFERAVQDYFDQLDSDRNEKRQLDSEQRGAEGFENQDVMKLLSFVSPDEQDAKNTDTSPPASATAVFTPTCVLWSFLMC